MKVLIAPDWRAGNPYQDLLAQALERQSVSVDFLQDYKRVFPLARSVRGSSANIFHLHWPEAFYSRAKARLDWYRHARFPADLELACQNRILAYTAHNLLPHSRHTRLFQLSAKVNVRYVVRRAGIIFAHSAAAKSRLVAELGAQESKVRVIPHGDLSGTLGTPIPRNEAIRALDIGSAPFALMFGAVDQYKSYEEIIRWWKQSNQPLRLAIAGKPRTPAYGQHLLELIGGAPNIIPAFEWLSEEQLRLWLSAASLVIFNYREILTSGAACLARSYGIPIVLPKRLTSVDLGESSPYVVRFSTPETDLGQQLELALGLKPDFEAAADWREACSWDRVARLTAEAYADALRGGTSHAK